MKNVKEFFDRNSPCLTSEQNPRSVRDLLKVAKKAQKIFDTSDEQLISMIVSKSEGALQKHLARALALGTPLDQVAEEIQQTFGLTNDNRIAAVRKIDEIKPQGQVRTYARQMLSAIREAAEYLDKNERRTFEEQTFKEKILHILPSKIAECVEIACMQENARTPGQVLRIILRNEEEIDQNLKHDENEVKEDKEKEKEEAEDEGKKGQTGQTKKQKIEELLKRLERLEIENSNMRAYILNAKEEKKALQ